MLNNRNYRLDMIRGMCIFLMMIDHIMLLTLSFGNIIWSASEGNAITYFLKYISEECYIGDFAYVRSYLRILVVSIFFIVSGICCSLSRNNYKRALRVGIVAVIISTSTYIISTYTRINIFIEWGVFHCYASCILIYAMLGKNNKNLLISVLLISGIFGLIVWFYSPTLSFTNVFMPWGITSDSFSYAIEFFPIFKWLPMFMSGCLIGKNLNLTKGTKKYKKNVFAFFGRHGVIVYLLHYIIISALLAIVGMF